jgi:mannose-6-phosphate isomerase-like protein (cupin superfamily)
MIINKDSSQEYSWGDRCKGWHLLNSARLSIIQEIMPQGTKEVRHCHRKAQQFFFVLKGEASFVVNGEIFRIREHEGIHIPPQVYHQISNATGEDLEFIVISEPHAHGDREVGEDR